MIKRCRFCRFNTGEAAVFLRPFKYKTGDITDNKLSIGRNKNLNGDYI
jgi:hypothetical protein